MYFFPLSRAAFTISRASSTVVQAGTVQATCLPARNAAIACGACRWIGELMCTASTAGSRRRSSNEVYRLSTPKALPTASSLSFDRWQIAYMFALGWRW